MTDEITPKRKEVKYLVRGWYVLDGKATPFSRIVDYDTAVEYLALASCRNYDWCHDKIDSIETIY